MGRNQRTVGISTEDEGQALVVEWARLKGAEVVHVVDDEAGEGDVIL